MGRYGYGPLGVNDVSMLDYSDLVCCGAPMEPRTVTISATHCGTKGFGCLHCHHFVSEMAFVQNSHGTRANRRARIATKQVGCAA